MQTLSLYEVEIDLILNLINRKIEKAKQKEIEPAQIEFVKELESVKANIEAQVNL